MGLKKKMGLDEFKNKIDKAERFLEDRYEVKGVCGALSYVFYATSYHVTWDLFYDVFSPDTPNLPGYWLGRLTVKNLPKRKEYLRKFEAHCIENNLYPEF